MAKAAQRVKRKRRTIERWISEGELPVLWVNGVRYVDEVKLLRVFREKLESNPARGARRSTGRER